VDAKTETIESLGLEPRHPDWAGGLRESWTPGEEAAQARLKAFLSQTVNGYADQRDRPDRDATSSRSPHLRFGEISPRQVWHAARFAAAEHRGLAGDFDSFVNTAIVTTGETLGDHMDDETHSMPDPMSPPAPMPAAPAVPAVKKKKAKKAKKTAKKAAKKAAKKSAKKAPKKAKKAAKKYGKKAPKKKKKAKKSKR